MDLAESEDSIIDKVCATSAVMYCVHEGEMYIVIGIVSAKRDLTHTL